MESSTRDQLAAQWTEPSDVFSVLLILGGDVIQLACAAMAGGPGLLPTPVAFSFGWVSFAISAVLSVIGEKRLLRCPPEVSLRVINLKTGYGQSNSSWLLSRFFRTYDSWMPEDVRVRIRPPPLQAAPSPRDRGGGAQHVDNPRADADAARAAAEAGWSLPRSVAPSTPAPTGNCAALCVAVYRWRDDLKPGLPVRDLVWWSGYAASALQLGIAAVPFGLYGDWMVFLATTVGTILAYTSASLRQWRQEKWHSRCTKKDIALTLGNGSEHVIVILGSDNGYDLEALASGARRTNNSWGIALSTSFLAALWLALLISCTGIKINTWYLLAVGGLGMLQNMVVAAAPRRPEAMGLPIKLVRHADNHGYAAEVFAEPKVMWTLMELESSYPGFGSALKTEFFPGSLRSWETQWWNSSDGDERAKLLAEEREKI